MLVTKQLIALESTPIETRYPIKLNAQSALDQIAQQQLYRWLGASQPIDNQTDEDKISNQSSESVQDSTDDIEAPEKAIDNQQTEQLEIKPLSGN